MYSDIMNFRGTYRFLSNFSPAPIHICGICYPTVEHAYQALKSNDNRQRLEISKTSSPADAKRMGRNVHLRAGWNDIRIHTMKLLIDQKFAEKSDLAEMLKGTDDAYIIEGNAWGDTFWGVCNGVGNNHLGKILMDRRTFLNKRSI